MVGLHLRFDRATFLRLSGDRVSSRRGERAFQLQRMPQILIGDGGRLAVPGAVDRARTQRGQLEAEIVRELPGELLGGGLGARVARVGDEVGELEAAVLRIHLGVVLGDAGEGPRGVDGDGRDEHDPADPGAGGGFEGVAGAVAVGAQEGVVVGHRAAARGQGGVGDDRVHALEGPGQRVGLVQVAVGEVDALAAHPVALRRRADHPPDPGAPARELLDEVGAQEARGSGDGDGAVGQRHAAA